MTELQVPGSRVVGSRDARFERIYRAHAASIHGMCRRVASDQDAAEDLMQKVFIRVWERLDRFQGDDAGAWIRTLARRVIINDRRTQKRLIARVRTDAHPPDAANVVVISQNTRLTLADAVEALTPMARLAFELHDVEGFRTAEIAEMLGIAPSTVRVHLARARATIGGVLAE